MTQEDPRSVDFGRTAKDYARHRPGFPAAFFDHVEANGWSRPGQHLLDLGTGTGTLARGFAAMLAERFPGPVVSNHRVYGIVGMRGGPG